MIIMVTVPWIMEDGRATALFDDLLSERSVRWPPSGRYPITIVVIAVVGVFFVIAVLHDMDLHRRATPSRALVVPGPWGEAQSRILVHCCLGQIKFTARC